jgi:phosphoenolpyruvate carboxylase
MHKLIPVEAAKALMNEAQDWGLWGWLTEKRRLRSTADAAWEALDKAEQKVRDSWSDDLKKAWHELEAQAAAEANPRLKRQFEKARDEAKDVDPDIKAVIRKLKDADREAYALHMQAEETFDLADKRMSTSMAREGAVQAIAAWEKREHFLRKLETVGRRK